MDSAAIKKLFEATESGDEEVVCSAIDCKTNLGVKDSYGLTPLMNACWFEHHGIVKMLIEAKSNLNAQSKVCHSFFLF